MKQRLLPIGFISFLIAGLISFVILSVEAQKSGKGIPESQEIKNGTEYLAKIRHNQHTGLLDPKDVMQARNQASDRSTYKSGMAEDFSWQNLGPDNKSGRIRSLIFDNRDETATTMYAGSVSGGVFKTENLGQTWLRVNNSTNQVLNVSCMVQDNNGTIYVGTGEGFNTENYSGFDQLGYIGGFMGKGIFKSDGNDNFSLIPGTAPVAYEEEADWAFINELVIDNSGNRMFAATNTGLKYASMNDLSSWDTMFKKLIDSTVVKRQIVIDSLVVCDSLELDTNGNVVAVYGSTGWQINIISNDTTSAEGTEEYIPFETTGICYDVKVNSNGSVITNFEDRIYVSQTGDVAKFENCSKGAANPDSYRMDIITYNSTITYRSKAGVVLFDDENMRTDTSDWHTDYIEAEGSSLLGYPPSSGAGRTEFAFAPSDPNVVYALVSKGSSPNRNSLMGIYMSEDNGTTWRTVLPGGAG